MSLPANDPLQSGSTQVLTTYSANWTFALHSNISVNATGAFGTNANDVGAFWNADSFPNDQYAQVTLTGSAAGAYLGVIVRASVVGGGQYYAFRASRGDSTYQVGYWVGGVFTSNFSGTVTRTFADNDVIRLAVVGATLTAYHNGVSIFSTTDSNLTSGSAGINTAAGAGPPFMFNWQGGASTGPVLMGQACL